MKMIKIKPGFQRRSLDNVIAITRQQANNGFGSTVKPGSSIGIAVGSRGIRNLTVIVKTLVSFLEEKGARPFIFPAMGSHGSANPDGQKEVLASYGITEPYMGAPVMATADYRKIEAKKSPCKVYLSAMVDRADGIILINRIKPHTDFRGKYESGLIKMAVIGLGGPLQASEIHQYGVKGLRDYIPEVAKFILGTGKILGGLAIVEDAYDQTMHIAALHAQQIWDEEPRLLKMARDHMPFLPVTSADVLMVKELGKDISGTGMDTNIIGRMKIEGEPEPAKPQIKRIAALDLTPASHGNAIGVGLADVISQRLFDKIDLNSTRENIVTSTFLERGKIPVVARTDREAMEIALRSCGVQDLLKAKIMVIRNTLQLGEIYISAALADELKNDSNIEILSESHVLFNAAGDLAVFND
ncbi:MAG: hypothetical protein JJU28_06130 [Cyclobacteriaceae bacterium]|nr:hypothetical protein [Cyclobacteriaceae bacterium]